MPGVRNLALASLGRLPEQIEQQGLMLQASSDQMALRRMILIRGKAAAKSRLGSFAFAELGPGLSSKWTVAACVVR